MSDTLFYSILTFVLALPLGAAADSTSEEPHVVFSDQMIADSGITLETAGPATLRIVITLPGRLAPNEDKVAHMAPRFPGVVREVRKRLGDIVKQGETLALIESNQTLQPYQLQSLISGTVTERHATLGEFAGETTELFTVADYSELFADFNVFESDVSKITIGQKVSFKVRDSGAVIDSTISFISPIVDIETQSRFARAVVSNPELRLQPGEFVSGDIVTGERPVPLAVRQTAIQNIEGKSYVFVRQDRKLVAKTVVLGESDGQFTAVLEGLKPEEHYASGNTFLLKAELGKGEAEHED